MDERDWLAARFQQHRPRLRAVAYRMLGSTSVIGALTLQNRRITTMDTLLDPARLARLDLTAFDPRP